MKKIFYSLLFIAIGITTVSAQSLGKNDPDAKKLLDAVTAKFKTYKSVQAKFTLKIETAAGKALASILVLESHERIDVGNDSVSGGHALYLRFDLPKHPATRRDHGRANGDDEAPVHG